MRAGKLIKKALIRRLVQSTDALGGVSESWQDFGQSWCGFIALRGGERATAIGAQSTMVGTVFFRYSALTNGIKIGDLIQVDGVDYTAISPAVNESLKGEGITVAVSKEAF
jgi:head-tail adaptor